MRINIIGRLKSRLSAAIDWRVREEYKSEHEIVAALSKTVSHLSLEFADQVRIQSEMIENLQKRVSELENNKFD